MRRDQPPPFPRIVVELYSFVIQGSGNNTCIIGSVKLPFPEAVLQPAPVGTSKNVTCERTGETNSGPLCPYKPQLVGIALIKIIKSPYKECGKAASLSFLEPPCCQSLLFTCQGPKVVTAAQGPERGRAWCWQVVLRKGWPSPEERGKASSGLLAGGRMMQERYGEEAAGDLVNSKSVEVEG